MRRGLMKMIKHGGMIASEVRSSGDRTLSVTGESDTLCPMPGWWMFVKKQAAKETVVKTRYGKVVRHY